MRENVSLSAELVQAVARRDVERCATLLDAGADPNAVNGAGDTPLHLAVKQRDARLAALLLAKGADYRCADAQGRAPLDPVLAGVELLHRIRQEYHRLPDVSAAATASPSAEDAGHIRTLGAHGIVHIAGFLEPAVLGRLQHEFPAFVRRLRMREAMRRLLRRQRAGVHYDEEEYWIPGERMYSTNNAFGYSPALLELSLSGRVTAIVGAYLRKPAFVQRAQAMRYLPSTPLESSQFHWHHDMEDRRLKMMLLLTDVGEDGQYMSYVLGSHAAYHPYERFLENSLDFEYCATYLPNPTVFQTIGRAGDAFFFDSNGMHRGRRTMAGKRDAYFVEYSADKNQNWGATIPPRLLARIADSPTHPLHRMRHTTPKWLQLDRTRLRTVSTWAMSLEDPESWVW